MIWDSETNCEHKWEGQQAIAPSNLAAAKKDKEWSAFRSEKYLNQPAFKPTTQFCSLCGAWRGCLGLEPTIELYLKHLVGIFDEAKRVLRDDGVCFVNLGDTYMNASSQQAAGRQGFGNDKIGMFYKSSPVIQEKSLCLIPQRFAQAMTEPILRCRGKGCRKEIPYREWNTTNTQNGKRLSCPVCGHITTEKPEIAQYGWILRNTIIWSKPNPMPSSAKDRFTVDFEYVFFFSKKKKYWFEQQYDDYTPDSDMAYRKTLRLGKFYRAGNQNPYKDNTPLAGDRKATPLAEGRNKRTTWTIKNEPPLHIEDEKICREITQWLQSNYPQQLSTWTIPTEAFPEAHFATFPCALVEPMIKCGCPEFVCPKCGKARKKIYETIGKKQVSWGVDKKARVMGTPGQPAMKNIDIEIGLISCSCNAGYEPGVVMDFFAGSGTVGKVAAYLRRNYILIDAKQEYCQMAEERIAEPETGVSVAEQRIGQQSLFEREGNE